MGGNFIPEELFFHLFANIIHPLGKRVFFNYIMMDISTLFVEKVDIATILLNNLILGCYLHQIGRYFHFMRIVFIRVEITTRFHQKPPLKQDG